MGAIYGAEPSVFNMLLAAENAEDRPPIGFCIEFLLGSKYAGLELVVQEAMFKVGQELNRVSC